MTIYVQFKDDSKTEIVSWFGRKPKPDSEPHVGEVEASDQRYKAYFEKFPEEARMGMPAPENL
jgi:hypothetical protein